MTINNKNNKFTRLFVTGLNPFLATKLNHNLHTKFHHNLHTKFNHNLPSKFNYTFAVNTFHSHRAHKNVVTRNWYINNVKFLSTNNLNTNKDIICVSLSDLIYKSNQIFNTLQGIILNDNHYKLMFINDAKVLTSFTIDNNFTHKVFDEIIINDISSRFDEEVVDYNNTFINIELLVVNKDTGSSKTSESSNNTKSTYYNSSLIKIRDLFNHKPINNDLQIEIEKICFNSVALYEKEKINLIDNIDFNNINPKLRTEIFNVWNKLKSLLGKFDKKMDDIINRKDDKRRSKESNQKLKTQAVLSKDIFKTLGVNYIATTIISYWFRFISVYYINNTQENREKTLSVLTFNTKLGKNILKNYNYKKYLEYKKVNKNNTITMSEWYKVRDIEGSEYLTDEDFIASFGTKFAEFICRAALDISDDNLGLLETKLEKSQKKQVQMIVIPNHIQKIMDDENKPLVTIPYRLPMIVPPKSYSPDKYGGYLTNDEIDLTELIKDKPHYKYKSEIGKVNNIYDMVNHISKVGYKINNVLLDLIISKGVELGITSPEVATKKSDILNKDYPNEKIKKLEINKYKSMYSKWILEYNIIQLAELYRNLTIYFPLSLDQRGRLYCLPNFLNYQSSDLSKALLSFSKPGLIKRDSHVSKVESLFIYGANTFGLDKASYNKRIKWVKDNQYNIINYENGILIKQAENKPLFAAFCIEYKRYNEFLQNENLTSWETFLPVQLDATCNGFQHLSLLSQETKLYKALNLTKATKSEKPYDFYAFILTKLMLQLKILLNSSECKENKDSLIRIEKFNWMRSMYKNIIMTIPYNATAYGSTDKITKNENIIVSLEKDPKTGDNREVYRYKDKKEKLYIEDIGLFIKIIFKIVKQDFEQIKKLLNYLNIVAKICNTLNIPITWHLPQGLTVKQGYLIKESISLPVYTYSRQTLNIIKSDKNNLDKPKQSRAFMPNLIHSLDAATMTLLFKGFHRVSEHDVNLFTVHDCFATTANNVPFLLSTLKEVYISLYKNGNYMKKFDTDFIKYIFDSYGRENVQWNEAKRELQVDNLTFTLPKIENIYPDFPVKDSIYCII